MRDPVAAGVGVLSTAIVVLSLAPDSMTPDTSAGGDWNLGHTVAYGVLTLSATALLRRRHSIVRAAATGALAASVLGILMEWLQPMFGRTQSIRDLAMNELGVASALVLISLHARRRRLR